MNRQTGNHPEWTVGQGGAIVPCEPVAITVAGAGEVAVNGVHEQEASDPLAFRRRMTRQTGIWPGRRFTRCIVPTGSGSSGTGASSARCSAAPR